MAEVDSTRVCTCCKTELPATRDYFHAYKRAPDGCRAVCRVCRAKDHSENKEERSQKKREHWAANKDRLLAISRKYYAENTEEQREQARQRHWKNREDRLTKMRQYRAENFEAINARKRVASIASWHEKYGVDLEFTLKHRVRSLIRATLVNGRSGKRMREILGYSTVELRSHIESLFAEGMSWAEFLAGKIHIDHIRPVSSFNITSDQCDDFKACWALSNLQPLWAFDNLSKGAKILELA